MSRVMLPTGSLWISFKDARRAPRAEKPAESGYPPYNIELLPRDEGEPTLLRITFAVAGFKLEDLDVTVEDGQLIVRGKQCEDKSRDYLYRGIATRQFKRSFDLTNGVVAHRAELHDGLLTIELERPRKEERVRRVGISSKTDASKTETCN